VNLLRRSIVFALAGLSAAGAFAQGAFPNQPIKLVVPDVPTVAESGYKGFEAVDWKALVAPAGTLADAAKRLNTAVNKALSRPDTIAALLADGSAPMGGTPEQSAQFLKAEHARWGAIVRDAGIKPD
jgi:tripartite-type tricarboxylate transporter receptor subunit TctC